MNWVELNRSMLIFVLSWFESNFNSNKSCWSLSEFELHRVPKMEESVHVIDACNSKSVAWLLDSSYPVVMCRSGVIWCKLLFPSCSSFACSVFCFLTFTFIYIYTWPFYLLPRDDIAILLLFYKILIVNLMGKLAYLSHLFKYTLIEI